MKEKRKEVSKTLVSLSHSLPLRYITLPLNTTTTTFQAQTLTNGGLFIECSRVYRIIQRGNK